MKDMEFLTDDILERAIDGLGDVFDSGEHADEVRRIATQEYARELYKRVDKDNPFQALHSDIASRLLTDNLAKRVEKVGEKNAQSIKGTPTRIAVWRKK